MEAIVVMPAILPESHQFDSSVRSRASERPGSVLNKTAGVAVSSNKKIVARYLQLGRIKISHLGNVGWRSKHFSITFISFLVKVIPF